MGLGESMDNKRLTKKIVSSGNGVSKKRRALVKGSAAAVPAILTLRSGAALAATSTSQCIANNQLLAQRLDPDALPSKTNFNGAFSNDPWVRQTVQCRFLRNGDPANQTDEFWVFEGPGSTGVWFKESDNTGSSLKFGDAGSLKMTGGGQTYDIIMADNRITADVIGIFDSGVNDIVGYGTDPERSHITKSCYASVINRAVG